VTNKKRICYFAAVRFCRVTIQDMDGVAHTVEVTAAALYEAYEAVAQGLAAIRANDSQLTLYANSVYLELYASGVPGTGWNSSKPDLHSLRLRLSDGRRVSGTTKPAGGCTRTWSRYPWNRRISEASLGRAKTRQRTKRRSASDLLLLPRRTTNLADYALRQGRSFRPYA
jgi:hypothetical protein